MENCQQIVVNTLFGQSYTFMIKDIQKGSTNMIGLYAMMKRRYGRDYIPIQVQGVPLMIEREMNLQKNLKNKGKVMVDMEVFQAVLNGMEIENDPSKVDEVIIVSGFGDSGIGARGGV